jgi:hypothetical protein
MTKRGGPTIAEQTRHRAMLHVEPWRPVAQMAPEEFERFTRENGELFTMRLGWFRKLAYGSGIIVGIGEQRAAHLLKQCRNWHEACDLWDRMRHGEKLPDAGGDPIGARTR